MKIIILVCLASAAILVHAEAPFRRNSKQFQFSRQQQLPDIYGPPQPQPEDPNGFTTETSETTTQQEPENTDTARARKLNEKLTKSEKLTKDTASRGVYYIYHPTGLLQKVSYTSRDDARQMAFAAKLKYENVEPISGPVYTYDPETYVFKRLQ